MSPGIELFKKILTALLLNLQLKKYKTMKKGFLLFLLASSILVHGQSLKEALYSGKLKNQPGTVIRKGDDLASKMDTSHKVAMEDTTSMTKTTIPSADAPAKNQPGQNDSTVVTQTNLNDASTGSTDTANKEVADLSKEAAPKNNNVIWKQYIDSVTATLKTEVLPSKKIKRGSYYVLVSYTIDTAKQVTLGDVFVSPENNYLQQQIKERLTVDTPHLIPVLSSSGMPRKVIKKFNFTLSKE